MIESFLTYIKDQNLISAGDTVLVSVSGGVDSMVLTELLVRNKIAIGVGHINHSLRGEESDADAELVRTYCIDKGIRYHQVKLPQDFFDKGNLQSKAREFRYQWLRNIASDHGYTSIATAHHLDDSIETFFINLLRGTGLEGIKGIKSKAGDIIRPILFAHKTDIIRFADENKIPYREDSSNTKDTYTRNKIRHHLIPLLSELDTRFNEHIEQTINNISRSNELYTYLISQSIEKNINGDVEVDISNLVCNENLKIEWLYQIIKRYGFNETQAIDILSKPKSSRLFESEKFDLYQKDTKITITLKSDHKRRSEYVLNQNGVTILENGVKLMCTTIQNSENFRFSKDQVYLDADKINGEIKVRYWKDGDKLMPLGMEGKTKSLQDIFTDKKLNRKEKAEALILEVKDTIAAVVPYTNSELYKITDLTKNILVIHQC